MPLTPTMIATATASLKTDKDLKMVDDDDCIILDNQKPAMTSRLTLTPVKGRGGLQQGRNDISNSPKPDNLFKPVMTSIEEMDAEVSCIEALPAPERSRSTHSSSGYNSNTSEDGLQLDSSYPVRPHRKESPNAVTLEGTTEASTELGEEDDINELVVEMERLVGSPILEQVIESQYPIDIVLSCNDGKVGAHRVVLVAASPFLKLLLEEHKLGEVATLILPDISKQVMTFILQLCYDGKVVFPPGLVDEIIDGMAYLVIGDGTVDNFSLRGVKVVAEESNAVPSGLSSDPADPPCIPPPENINETSTSNNISPPSPDDAKDSSDTESSPETDDDEDEEFVENPALKKTFCAVLSVCPDKDGDGYTYSCTTCDSTLSTRCNFAIHTKNMHGREMRKDVPSKEDILRLSYCPVCNVHHNSVTNAEECLKKHDLTQCYNCFELIKYDEFASHYKKAHGMRSKQVQGWVAGCQWCDTAVVISSTGQLLRRHARFSHISRVVHPKKLKTWTSTTSSTKVPIGNSAAKPTDVTQNADPKSPQKLTRSRMSLPNTSAAATPGPSTSGTASSTFLTPLPPGSSQKITPGRRSSTRITRAVLPLPKKRRSDFKHTSNSDPTSDMAPPPAKKRRLDEHGNPLQLGKRRGLPVGRQKGKILTPDMKFTSGAFLLEKDTATAKIPIQKINELPKVHVHIEMLSEEEDLTPDSEENDTIQDLPLLPDPQPPEVPQPEPRPQQSSKVVEQTMLTLARSICDPSPPSRAKDISEADTQIILDPFEATKTVRTD